MSAHERTKRFTILLRKGDQVKVMAGKDAGKSGRVLSVNPRKNTVIVEHANIIKRHTRPNPGKNIKGGIVEKEAGLNVSKVMIVCGSCMLLLREAKSMSAGMLSRVWRVYSRPRGSSAH